MTSNNGDPYQGLLDQAQQRLQQQHDDNPNADLGDSMTPEPGQHFAGRWRGTGEMVTSRGNIRVFLVWDRDGKPGFLFQHARLVTEVNNDLPEVGDKVLVLRGETETFEKDGDQRTIFPYAMRRMPCPDPLPTGTPVPAVAGDDIPF